MRYKYCPKCNVLRPKTFMMDDRCEACREDALTISVKRSAYGLAMYVVSLVAAALIILYVAYHDFNASFASFMSAISGNVFIVLIFAMIIVAFALSFLDLGRTNAEARRVVDERKGKWRV